VPVTALRAMPGTPTKKALPEDNAFSTSMYEETQKRF